MDTQIRKAVGRRAFRRATRIAKISDEAFRLMELLALAIDGLGLYSAIAGVLLLLAYFFGADVAERQAVYAKSARLRRAR